MTPILSTTEQALADALREGPETTWADQTEAIVLAERLADAGYELVPIDREPLPTTAGTRRGHPETSRTAADSIDDLGDRQRAVLEVARTLSEPWTYDHLAAVYRSRQTNGYHELPAQEPQSIRSRCAELRRAGWIAEAGVGVSDAGRRAKTWKVAS